MAEQTNQISIKGVRDGILIDLVPGSSLEDALRSLEDELLSQHGFLRGSRVILSVGERNLFADDLLPFQELLAQHKMTLWALLTDRESSREAARELGLATRLPGSNADLNGNVRSVPARPPEAAVIAPPNGSANSLLLRETLRSGRSVHHDGHVVVIGDVNPGAEVIAAGDVVVWGKLRGLVHAGAHGDSAAVICALALSPTQLRIADQIAIAPGEQRRRPIPEKVSLIEGQIVAEAWDTRH
ncbi:MAG: septum site-determining protein MinC [Chloroflexota bacterium]|nr:MAG: septum site-determining protein MinC [Chloroflexota bacterium]